MRGVFFDQRVAPVARSPYRADVALFVGFVDRRRQKHAGKTPPEQVIQPIVPTHGRGGEPQLYRWLVDENWARGDEDVDRAAGLEELLNVPVPIDSFDSFHRLFAWDHRPSDVGRCDTYLGAAVRAFFVQGGRLCYVVRVGVPWSVALTTEAAEADVAARAARLAQLVPASGDPAAERRSWRGVWLVHGLPDVSFLALPDLPDIVRAPIAADRALPPPPPLEVGFVECSDPPGRPVEDLRVRELRAPASDDAGFTAWATLVARLAGELGRMRSAGSLREVQLVAAIPRPADDRVGADLLRFLTLDVPVVATAFLQLVYPWLVTAASQQLPAGVEPPDGALCGVLARNALERGTYRSIGGRALIDAIDALPLLPARDVADPANAETLGGRVTLLGRTPGGIEVLSDVTTSRDATFRLAHANRLMSALVRALRVIGEGLAFAPNSPLTWAELRARATDVLREFWRAGALRGTEERDAFDVRCGDATTSQNDLDAGRVIVEVTVALSVSIQRINVTVTSHGGAATLERAA
jgi:Bacteriophage tail sheath protein